jgi:hypothetical protein
MQSPEGERAAKPAITSRFPPPSVAALNASQYLHCRFFLHGVDKTFSAVLRFSLFQRLSMRRDNFQKRRIEMSLFGTSSSRKSPKADFDPKPEIVAKMPVRPYLVLHANLPFYSDPECKNEVTVARLVILRSEDPRQQHHPVDCMPTRKNYSKGQILRWEIDNKRQWEDAWYIDPETGNIHKAWARAVEFLGVVVNV